MRLKKGKAAAMPGSKVPQVVVFELLFLLRLFLAAVLLRLLLLLVLFLLLPLLVDAPGLRLRRRRFFRLLLPLFLEPAPLLEVLPVGAHRVILGRRWLCGSASRSPAAAAADGAAAAAAAEQRREREQHSRDEQHRAHRPR